MTKQHPDYPLVEPEQSSRSTIHTQNTAVELLVISFEKIILDDRVV